ncbi:MAG: hypothetical protein ACMUIE_10225 [Thermoplasmatota archaeon]
MEKPMVIKFQEDDEANEAPTEFYESFVSTVVTYFSNPEQRSRKKRKKEGRKAPALPNESDLLYV